MNASNPSPLRPVPPKAASERPPGPPQELPLQRFGFKKIEPARACRAAFYGTGGIGKTTLAAHAPAPVVFFDLDSSLPVLLPTLAGLDIRAVAGVRTWADLRAALSDGDFSGIKTIVIDSVTRAEALAVAHTLATVPHEKGHRVSRLEDYGFGKGPQHVFETFMILFADLDRHIHAGRNIVLICHECTATVPNPTGDDWLRYEPRLQSPTSGKASIRLALKEWTDHLCFLGYDVITNRDGKGVGHGSRTIYPCETPSFMAKSRKLRDPIPLVEGSREFWEDLGGM